MPLALVVKKGSKTCASLSTGDAGAGVVHADLQDWRAGRRIGPRRHADPSIPQPRSVEGVHAIEHEVEQDLLDMYTITVNVRQIARHVHVQLHLARRRIDPHERRDLIHERAHAEPPRVDRVTLEQAAHPVDDLAGSLVVRADIAENGADLLEIRGWVLKMYDSTAWRSGESPRAAD